MKERHFIIARDSKTHTKNPVVGRNIIAKTDAEECLVCWLKIFYFIRHAQTNGDIKRKANM